MNEPLGFHILGEIVRQHVVSAIFLSLTLATILTLLGVRWWLRRRFRRIMEDRFNAEHELDALPSPGPNDREALELIKRFRREVWNLPEAEIQLSVDALNQQAVRIVRAVAAIYHSDVVEPQYEATLVELLQMTRRVSGRLTRLASSVPFKYLGNRKVSDYQRYYQVYRKINENPFVQIFRKNPHLQRAARWAVNLKNIGNPLYWAGKELSREGYFYMLRWFYVTFIGQVGREAVYLYSGRHFQREEDRDAALVCYRLFALAGRWGGPSSTEWSVLVDLVTGHPILEPEVKVEILSRCVRGKLPKDLEAQSFQTGSGVKWYRDGLRSLLDAEAPWSTSPGEKARLVEEELNVMGE